ncbi:hypothetical protein [Hyphomicrobium sp. CS1GBMeth3]|uniref:hypothetical protein n=1 Tax=Hyphomicrobium sp. CS1GBMeth3 TaxID=1892845 RepID=UPI0015C532EA|nr:hypothetical protein [Hyphomicrobium sp. CS1GBMeth3]
MASLLLPAALFRLPLFVGLLLAALLVLLAVALVLTALSAVRVVIGHSRFLLLCFCKT